MNTTIIVPGKIQATAPKPTKAQLMEALLDRARTAHGEAEAIKETKRAALEAEGMALVLEGFKKAKPTTDNVHFYNRYRWQDNEPTVTVTVINPKIKAIIKKMHDLEETRFDEDATKTKIREGLKAPNPLLDNTDVSKALDQLLATIMGQPKLDTIDV